MVSRAAGTASLAASQRAGVTDWVQASWAVPFSSSRPISAAPAQRATSRGAKLMSDEPTVTAVSYRSSAGAPWLQPSLISPWPWQLSV